MIWHAVDNGTPTHRHRATVSLAHSPSIVFRHLPPQSRTLSEHRFPALSSTVTHTPCIAFRHLPPQSLTHHTLRASLSATFLHTHTLRASLSGTFLHSHSYTPSIAFRHLPANSARISYATEGTPFLSAQLSTDAVSALRNVSVLISNLDAT